MKIFSSAILTALAQVAIFTTAASVACQVALIVGLACSIFSIFAAIGEK